MHIEKAQHNIEAILFASGEPVEIGKICEVLELDDKTVKSLIGRIRERYIDSGSPFEIATLGDAVQMCTLPEYSDVIREALTLKRGAALSQAALEVLAVVAYNQPVTRSFIEQVRGVDCSTLIRALVDKSLVEEAGRLPIPGKPISYKTTVNFLRSFGMESLEQLPELPDLDSEPENTGDEDEQIEGQMDFFEPA